MMKSIFSGYASLLLAALLLAVCPSCTTKFKASEDAGGDDAAAEADETDVEAEGMDGEDAAEGVDGNDSLEDIAETTDGEEPELPSPCTLEVGGPYEIDLSNEFGAAIQYRCNVSGGKTDQHANLRSMVSNGRLFLAASHQTVDASEVESDHIWLLDLVVADSFEVHSTTPSTYTPGDRIHAIESTASALVESSEYLYVFQVVHDYTSDPDYFGNVRITRFNKDLDGISYNGENYMFDNAVTLEIPAFTDILVRRCGEDKYHVILKGEGDAPGEYTDYFGYTLANDTSNEDLDRILDEGQGRVWQGSGDNEGVSHFISSEDIGESIMMTDGTCSGEQLAVAGQEMIPEGIFTFSMESEVMIFPGNLIRGNTEPPSQPDRFEICSPPGCGDGEPVTEGIPSILGAGTTLYTTWFTIPELFSMEEEAPEPSTLHAGAPHPDDPYIRTISSSGDITHKIYPATFDCGGFSGDYFKMLHDPVHEVIHAVTLLTGEVAGEPTAEVAIFSFDEELRPLAGSPLYINTGLPVMLGYEAAIDPATGTIILAWFDYHEGDWDPLERTGASIETEIDTIVIRMVTCE